ncbi:MAG TPA: zinc ribbon domain-containing protein [Gammaproteobacteria bacterium]|nr:zinc ribbon domain-containing protein [Gammaproteobacteria bacterium]
MPIYEYRCRQCGHELEVMQKMSDAPLSDCPQCREPALTKLISAAGFQLKGSGWYATDFKDNGKKKSAAGEKGEKKDAKPGAEPPCGAGACPACE